PLPTSSTDDVGVTGYRVERCPGAECSAFTPVATPPGTTYSDTGLSPSTSYSYQVRAVDAAGNVSGASPVARATTASVGATERVSVDSAGTQANGASFGGALSADGRFGAFISVAPDLVAGDTNGVADVFVHDRQTRTTERVSVDSAGTQANGDSTE